MEQRQHHAQVAGDGRLPRQQRLDPAGQIAVDAIDLVVEGDHLVGELRVALLERLDRAASERRTSSPSSISAAWSMSSSSCSPDAHQPNRPVT